MLGTKSLVTIIVCIIIALALIFCGAGILDSNKSGQIVIKQAAITGKMSAIISEGVFWQLWGAMHRYPRSETYYFSSYVDEGGAKNESIPVTFKNGSQGNISGSVRYDYPLSEDSLVGIHRKYKSDPGVRNDLIRTEIRKLVSVTASLMLPEAAMTQKGLFLQRLTDQIENGQYVTEAGTEEYTNPITKETSIIDVVKVVVGEDKNPLRMANPFKTWNISMNQVVVQNIVPDQRTTEMIAKRRDAEMKVMVAKADVERANQEKLKVEAEGKKSVSENEYAALQEKVTATVKADREKEVAEIGAQRKIEVAKRELEAAKLDRLKAEQEKLAAIERGTGEAEARKLIMVADGALSVKIAAWERVMTNFAKSYENRKVPTIVSGGREGEDSNFLSTVELFGFKLAKDLALDMSIGAKQEK